MDLLLLLLSLMAQARDAAVIVDLSDDERVEDWLEWLVAETDVDPRRVTVLRGEQATREAMLDSARQELAEGEVLWWVFLGHREGDTLVGSDGQRVSMEELKRPDGLVLPEEPGTDILPDLHSDWARELAIHANALRVELGLSGDRVQDFPPELVAACSRAADAFQGYLTRYPAAEDRHEMRWYLADILYKAQRFEEAWEEYETLWATREEHPYGEGALYQRFVTAQRRLRLRFDTFDELPADAVLERIITTEWGKEIELYELSEDHRRVIEAADAILDHHFAEPTLEGMPDFAAAVENNRRAIMYIPAQILYHHGRFDEARPRLWALVQGYRGSKEACFSGGLLVDSCKREGSLADVRDLSADFSRDPICRIGGDIIQPEPVGELSCFQPVQRARELETDGRHRDAWPHREQAAECFLEFVDANPDSEYVDVALFNAANNYQILGQVQRSNQLFEDYLRRFPDDENSRPLYMRIAGNYEATFDLERAIWYYDELARRFPDYQDSSDAVYNASFLRIGLGRYREAAQGHERYATEWEREDAADVFWRAPELWEKVSPQEALSSYERYLARFSDADPSRVVVAHCHRARLLGELGRERQFAQAAEEALAAFDLVEDPSTEARHCAAALAFPELQAAHDRFVSQELLPLRTRNEGANTALLLEQMPAELAAFEEQANAFMARYRDFEYSSAALYLIGSAYLDYVDLGFSLGCPREYDEETCTIFREILYDSVYPKFDSIEDKGLNRLQALVAKARAEKQNNEWIQRAEELLHERDPTRWPLPRSPIPGDVRPSGHSSE